MCILKTLNQTPIVNITCYKQTQQAVRNVENLTAKMRCQNFIITNDIVSTGCTRPVWHIVRVKRLRGRGVRWTEHVAHMEEKINENGSIKTCIEISS